MTGSVGDAAVIACAELFRGDRAILASPMSPVARLGAMLARATFAPELVLTDGTSRVLDADGAPTAWLPFGRVFDLVWSGRRHVIMGATQVDQHGNTNISCLGDHARPKVQLLGARGAPGNTVCHPTSYFVPDHSPKVFVEQVDFISGVGPGRGAVEIRGVVTNLAVFDLRGPGGVLRLVSVHPGVTEDDVRAATGCPFVEVEGGAPTSRLPTAEERAWLDRWDADGAIRASVKGPAAAGGARA
jgi:acyl CoA:acetate/3-ketoacid CoA transferase beta subunit